MALYKMEYKLSDSANYQVVELTPLSSEEQRKINYNQMCHMRDKKFFDEHPGAVEQLQGAVEQLQTYFEFPSRDIVGNLTLDDPFDVDKDTQVKWNLAKWNLNNCKIVGQGFSFNS